MHTKFAPIFLLAVAAIWGLTFPLIESAMKFQDPFLFVALRFTIATLPILPYFFRHITKDLLKAGLWIGFLNCGAFLTQTIGLKTVPASRAAFLTGMYVLLIPFLTPFFRMGKPLPRDILGALLCCVGIYVLTGCDIGSGTTGDLWIIACSFFVAVSVIYIGKVAKKDYNPFMIAYSQIVMTCLFAWGFSLFFSDFRFSALQHPEFLVSLGTCGLLATIVAILLQSKYQKYVSVEKTALIFSLEPLFGALFDSMIRKALPDPYTVAGGVIILVGIVFPEWLKYRTKIVLRK